ncbi:MAG: hypothetical protein Q7J48_09330 [Nocardioides sp.]|nr:hypothetical protein [Nocardioides sp.]
MSRLVETVVPARLGTNFRWLLAWFAFVGSAVFVVLIWRQLTHIAHADAAPATPATPAR